MKHLYCLLLCGLVSFHLTFAQKTFSYEKEFRNIEKKYEKGDYKKALRKLKSKTKSSNKALQTLAYLYKAKVYEAQGLMKKMEEELANASKVADEIKATNPKEYSIYLVKLASFYNLYGNPLKVLGVLENPENQNIISANAPALQRCESIGENAKAHLATGNFKVAEKNFSQALAAYDSLLRNKSLRSVEKSVAKRQKARLLTQKAFLETKRGYYDRADSLLNAYKVPVRKLTSVVDMAYIEHLIAFAKNREAQERFKSANQYYRTGQRANEYYDFAFKKSAKGYFLMQEGIVRNNIQQGNLLGYSFSMLKLKADTRKFFPANSVYQVRIKLLEVERLLQRRNYEKSLQELLGILENKNAVYLPADHELRALATKYLAKVYEKIPSIAISQVEKTYQDWLALESARYPQNSFANQVAQLELADFYIRESENFLEGKKIFEQNSLSKIAQNIAQANPLYIRIANWFANYYEATDSYNQALQIAEQNAEFAKKNYGFDNLRYAKQLEMLASVKAKNGDYKGAESAISQAVGIVKSYFAQEATNSPLYAEALTKMGAIQGSIANYAKADSLLRNAEIIFANYEKLPAKKKKDDEFNIETIKAESIEETARQYIRIGNYESTEKILLQVLKEREEKFGKDSRRLVRPLIELANLYIIRADYKKADEYLSRSLKISEKVYGKNSLIYAQNLEILARLQNSLSDVEGAKKSIADAVSIIDKIFSPEHIQNAPFLVSLAVIELAENPKGNFEKAEKKLLLARKIIEKTFDAQHPQYAEVLETMASLYLEVGKNEQVGNLLNQAEQIWLKKLGNKNIHIAKIASLKGETYLQQGKINEAEQSFQQAKNIYTEIFGEKYENFVKANSKLGRIYYIQRNYEKANQMLLQSTRSYLDFVEKNFSFLNERQKAKYWYSVQPDFEFFKNLVLVQLKTKPELVAELYDQLLATKGLLLSNSLKIKEKILASGNASLIKIYQDLLLKKELYITTLSLSAEERKKFNSASLEQEIADLEKKLSLEAEKLGINLDNKRPSWKDVKAQLKDGEVVLEFTRLQYFDKKFTDSTIYLVLKLDKNSLTPEAVAMPDGKVMEKEMLNFFRNTVIFNKINNTETYQSFWKPFEQLVQNAKKIYIASDGVYTQINPELLYNGKELLIDKHDFYFISSSKDLLTSNTNQKLNKKAILVANPEFYLKNKQGSKVSYLPGTLREANNIKQILQTNAWNSVDYISENASEEKIKNTRIDADILHFATHGFFLEDVPLSEGISEELSEVKALSNPMTRSGLLLAGAGDILENQSFLGDGILTAYEMANVNLDNTKIVVLSACETGRGEVAVGEGVFGLQRALLLAGAKNIVMSLFRVDDAATAELMTIFYKNYLENPTDAHGAFKKAKISIREKYQKPIYWGAFLMIGK